MSDINDEPLANGYLVEIPWETRNLGMQSFELSESFIAEPDEALLKEEIAEIAKIHGRIFVQVRVDKIALSIGPILERAGFCFIESTVVPFTILKRNEVLQRFFLNKEQFLYRRYALCDLSVTTADKNDYSQCRRIKEIAEGSFSDDRFHIDPYCSDDIASRRFSYWVDDLMAQDKTIFYVLMYQGQAIAFNVRKNDQLLLGGFAKEHAKSGLGDFFWLAALESAFKESHLQLSTLISANNIAALNLYSRLGFSFRSPAVTFHYWSERVR